MMEWGWIIVGWAIIALILSLSYRSKGFDVNGKPIKEWDFSLKNFLGLFLLVPFIQAIFEVMLEDRDCSWFDRWMWAEILNSGKSSNTPDTPHDSSYDNDFDFFENSSCYDHDHDYFDHSL